MGSTFLAEPTCMGKLYDNPGRKSKSDILFKYRAPSADKEREIKDSKKRMVF